MGPEGREVEGMKLVGGTPGLGIGGIPPGADDGGGPDKLEADIEGPGGGKEEGPLMGCGWNGC